MKTNEYMSLSLKFDQAVVSSFFPLLQQGFQVEAQMGRSVKHLLCEQFKVSEEYLADRVKTIFLDGKPVDDVETAIIENGATLALSAAMPGLVGATFRRGGVLGSFRSGITYKAGDKTGESDAIGWVKIKLFNLLVGELGPIFLKTGILVDRMDVEGILRERGDAIQPFIGDAEKNGQEIRSILSADLNGSHAPEHVLIKACD